MYGDGNDLLQDIKQKSDILFKQLPFDSSFKNKYKQSMNSTEQYGHLDGIIDMWSNIKSDLYTRMAACYTR